LQVQQEEVCRNTSSTATASTVQSIQTDEKTEKDKEVALVLTSSTVVRH